ncbi:MAG: polysaccharide biosynthesis/export family protein [Bacteroidota bacterium]
MRIWTYTLLYTLLATWTMSCVSHERLVLFGKENVSQKELGQFGRTIDTVALNGRIEPILKQNELRVKPDDILYIFLYSNDPVVAAPYNVVPGEQQRNTVDAITQGYLVDAEGYIDYPNLGRVFVSGQTRAEIKSNLEERLSEYVENPVVKVRFLNFQVFVMGEVRRPGVLQFQDENVTILEALSFAGDFTELANREKVMVIRERNGSREYAQLNLLTTDVFESPFLYLEQNDVIYVEPLTAKTSAVVSSPLRYLNIVGTVIGTVVGAILIVERLNDGP